jgi:hypothetical protein
MSREINTEKWLACLFSELIRRGIESDEHVHFKDSSIGEHYAPTLQELRGVHLGYVGEFLTPLLQEHLEEIIKEYQKVENQT